ncbi:MFS general substrate transporter [Hyaloraphidium curvatum]|nr:MFS general substrate transporter [Hyaloraphidium curvatum]
MATRSGDPPAPSPAAAVLDGSAPPDSAPPPNDPPTPSPTAAALETSVPPNSALVPDDPATSPANGTADPEGAYAEDVLPHDDVPELPAKDKAERKAELGDDSVVKWEPGEPSNPHNWGKRRNWILTVSNSILVLNATLASSAPSGVVRPILAELGGTVLQGTMLIALFVLGYVVGPLFWAPASEVLGRRPVNVVSGVGFFFFNLGCALVHSMGGMLALRFLAGTFAAAALTNAGGIIADVWMPQDRAMPMSVFSMMPFLGPVLGPVISGYMGLSYGWRSVFYFLVTFSGLCAVATFFMPETYHPVLLTAKARAIRKATGNTVAECASPVEKAGRSVRQLLLLSLTRPLMFLFTEPIVLLTSVYAAICYGVLYLLFTAFPIIFQGVYGFSSGEVGLVFLGIWLGSVIGLFGIMPWANKKYVAKKDSNGKFVPEERLWPAFVGGPLFVIGMFWLGWTSYPSIHWIVPALAGLPIGAGIMVIFMSTGSYVVDAYFIYAASALAAQTVSRSLLGFVFPLFSVSMFQAMGIHWACTLLACLALLMVPVPYGTNIRLKSEYARISVG